MLNKRILVLIFLLVFLPLVGCFPGPSNETPIITSVPITTATVGEAYTYDVNATDPDDDTLTYSLTVKPTGMIINSATGLIEWTPAAEGDYDVVVKVSDGTLDITQSFTIVVIEEEGPGWTPPAPPTKTYTITATADSGGSISPSGEVKVKKGSDKTFTITPDANYHIADVLVDGVSKGAVGTYDFTNVNKNHTIHANFAIDTYTITATADPGGSIIPSGTVVVNHGADQSFTITPDSIFYEIADVSVDGDSKGAVASYPFTNVTGDHTIEASFTQLGCVYNERNGDYFWTIQDAVSDDGNHGDTLLVMGGIYSEVVVVDEEGTTIRGENPVAIVDGGFWLQADYVTINNPTVKDGFARSPSGYRFAILTVGPSGDPYSTKGHTITNNDLIGDGTGVKCAGIGDGPDGSDDLVIYNNAIHGWRIGIMLSGASTNHMITENDIYENIKTGIELSKISNTTIEGNHIHDNTQYGIYVYPFAATPGNVINFNNIYGNTEYGVFNAHLTDLVYAEDNWWGSGGTGDDAGKPGVEGNNVVSANVDYIPWSTTPH